MGFDDTKGRFVGTSLKRGKKRNMHNRKARSLAKRNAWPGDGETIVATDPQAEPEEMPGKVEPAEPADHGFDDNGAGGPIPLDGYDMGPVTDTHDAARRLVIALR